MCLFNYTILKIVHPKQYIKRLMGKKATFVCILFIKNKFSFVQNKISWHLVVKVSVLLSIGINIKVLVLVSIKFKRYAAPGFSQDLKK